MTPTKANIDFARRWKTPEVAATTSELVQELKRGGGKVFKQSPFGESEGLVDFRGFPFHAASKIAQKSFEGADVSGASFEGVWLQECVFQTVKFASASLKGIKDHGNRFDDCSFAKASFVGAGLGYRQSTYNQCVFEETDFRRATFLAARFQLCRFGRSKLKDIDFYASSFVGCVFLGRLDNVWFRGGYSSPRDEVEFGKIEPNLMQDVSFVDADLKGVTFTGGCDLSSILLPKKGDYRLYGNWRVRLLRLSKVSAVWSAPERTEAEIFVRSYLESSAKQSWMLLNVKEISGEFGADLARKIFEVIALNHGLTEVSDCFSPGCR